MLHYLNEMKQTEQVLHCSMWVSHKRKENQLKKGLLWKMYIIKTVILDIINTVSLDGNWVF